MVVKQDQAQTESKISKKHWTAPEVTRLEFPKTAADIRNRGVEFTATYLVLS